MNSKIIVRASLFFCTAATLTLTSTALTAKALNYTDFKPGRIIDDVVFTNKSSMSVDQIQSFLNSKVPVCETMHPPYTGGSGTVYSAPFTCIKDYQENILTGENNYGKYAPDRVTPIPVANGKTAAQIIWQVAQEYSINPQVLIVLLQKEQGLITDTWPILPQYTKATGYLCPDTAPCSSSAAGFYKQVAGAGWQLRNDFNGIGTPGFWSPFAKGVNTILFNPNPACGTKIVNIETQATAVLYKYTPYTPNDAAITAAPGVDVTCGAYGNRNFWRMFNDWFGDSIRNLIQVNGSVYLVENGKKRGFPNEETFLSYSYKWSDILTISSAELGMIPSGEPIPYNVNFRNWKLVKRPSSTGIYLVHNGTKRPFPLEVTFLSHGYKWADVITISNTEMDMIPSGLSMPYDPSYRNGKLIQVNGSVYLVENGKKRGFPNEETFLSYSYKWSDILTISSAELGMIPSGEPIPYNVNFRNWKLVKRPSSTGIYLVHNGTKRPFPLEVTFLSHGYKWADVITISNTEMDMIPSGLSMPYDPSYRNGKLIQVNGSVYLVENGKKRGFPNEETFLSYSYKWSDILTISSAELGMIPSGEPMVPKPL